jgi:hypothetical protein
MQSRKRLHLAQALLCLVCAVTVTAVGQTTYATHVEEYPNAANIHQNPGDGSNGWYWNADSGTACCVNNTNTPSYTVASPSRDRKSRLFYVDYTPNGSGNPGVRYSTNFGTTPRNFPMTEAATHFAYEAYIYLVDPQNVANIEMDINQVWDSNDDVLIYGLQCAGVDGRWEYTINDPMNPNHTKWVKTTNPVISCNPANWTANTWHHVQLTMHQDNNGGVYYDSITLDGTTSSLSSWFGNSSFSFSPPWKPTGNLLLNFQLDGVNKGAGNEVTITAYVDSLLLSYY